MCLLFEEKCIHFIIQRIAGIVIGWDEWVMLIGVARREKSTGELDKLEIVTEVVLERQFSTKHSTFDSTLPFRSLPFLSFSLQTVLFILLYKLLTPLFPVPLLIQEELVVFVRYDGWGECPRAFVS